MTDLHKAYKETMAGIDSSVIKAAIDFATAEYVGENQWRTNHKGCPAGEDKKKRLYVKKLSESQWIGYCHHCSNSGAYFTNNTRPNSESLRRYLTGEKDKLHERTDAKKWDITDVKYAVGFNPEADEYLNKLARPVDTTKLYQGCDLGPGLTTRTYIAYRLHNAGGDLIGEQRRFFDDKGAKCKTMIHAGTPQYSPVLFYNNGGSKNILVIVEDPLSAMVIQDTANADAYCLLGSSMKTDHESYFSSRQFDNIIVWMDNDDAGIKGAAKIVTRLKYLNTVGAIGGEPAIWNLTGQVEEPKNCDQDPSIVIAKKLLGLSV